jgi:hypothetical protein
VFKVFLGGLTNRSMNKNHPIAGVINATAVHNTGVKNTGAAPIIPTLPVLFQ